MSITYSMDSFYSAITKKDNSYISPYKQSKRVLQENSDIQHLREDITDLRKKMRKLGNYDKELTGQAKLERQISKFAKSYNELKAQYSDTECDKSIKKEMDKLDKIIAEHEKELDKIGIKKKNEKLIFDSDKLEKANKKDIDTLFVGTDCFMNKAMKEMRKIDKIAQEKEYSHVIRKYATITKFSSSEIELATNANLLKSTSEYMAEKANEARESINVDTNINALKNNTGALVYAYNMIIKNQAINQNDICNAYVGYMKNLSTQNMDKLAAIGISIAEDETLSYNKEYWDSLSDDTKQEQTINAYAALFGESATYGSLIKGYAVELFKGILQTDKLGVTIDASI